MNSYLRDTVRLFHSIALEGSSQLRDTPHHTGIFCRKRCKKPRANLNTSSQIMRPASLTEFSLLKHSQTFRIWDWAPHDIFCKSRIVMVAESSGRRSMHALLPFHSLFGCVTEWNESVETFQHNWFITLWQRAGLRALVREAAAKVRHWSVHLADLRTAIRVILRQTETIWRVKLLLDPCDALFWLVNAFRVKLYVIVVTGNHSYTMLDFYLLFIPWSLFIYQNIFNSNQHVYLLTLLLQDLCWNKPDLDPSYQWLHLSLISINP